MNDDMNSAVTDNKLSHDVTLEGAFSSLKKNAPHISGTHLDIGSGTGYLIRRIRQQYSVTSSACDYTDEFMELDDIKVDILENVLNMNHACAF